MHPVRGIRTSSSERGRRLFKHVVSLIASTAVLLLGVAPASAEEATFNPSSISVSEDGTTAPYAVTLPVEPAASVVVTIGSPDGQVTTDPTSLTFTPENYDEPQEVLVSAVDDDVAEGTPHATDITHLGESDDSAYDGNLGSVSVAISDNDEAGVTIAESDGSTEVGEGGTSDSYTIVLDSEPTDDVTIVVSEADGQLTIDPAELVFSADDWDVPQTVTVDAADDDVAEGSHAAVISHDASSGDSDYALPDFTEISVAIEDNDTAGVTVDPLSLDVYEGGPAASYEVVLGSEPTADVTITASEADGQLTIDPTQLTFTAADWDVPQTVSAEAVGGDGSEGDHSATITHAAQSTDGNYEGIAVDLVDVSITDNDGPIVLLEPDELAPADVTVGEEGETTDTYRVVLPVEPASIVRVQLEPDGQTSVDPTELTFTPQDYNVPQTVTVTASEDVVDEDDPHLGAIVHRASTIPPAPVGDDDYDGKTAVLAVDVLDNDVADLIVTDDVAVSEAGQTDSYSVSLATEPVADVTVALTTDGQVTTEPASLTFTAQDYDQPQQVAVAAVNDDVNEGAHTGLITHGASSPDDAKYDGLSAQVTVDIEDDDVPRVTITESAGQTAVTEGGSPDGYQIRLDSEPADDVTITMNADPQVDVSPSSVTFTPATFAVPQQVVVTAVDDSSVNGTRQVSIGHASSSLDPGYAGVAVGSVDVTVFDNDAASIRIRHTDSKTEVGEGAETDTYEVRLTAEPSAPVTVDIAGTSQVDVFPTSLTFDDTNFDTVQAVTVTAVDDPDEEGTHSTTIGHAATSADSAYNGVTAAFDPSSDLVVRILDNDADVTITAPDDTACVATSEVTFEGTAGRVQPITVQNTAPAATTTAAADGSWTAIATFDDGEHTVTATDGVRTSDPVTFTVLSVPPTAPVITDPANDDVVGAEVTVTGTADEGQMITLFRTPPEPAAGEDPVDPEELGTATADANGDWSIDVTFAASGEVTLFARTADCAGITSDSDEVTFTVDLDGPEVTAEADLIQIAPGDESTASGTATDPNGVETITVMFNDLLTGSSTEGTVEVGEDGSWTATGPAGLGIYEVVVTATDVNGNESTASAMFIKL